MSVEDTTVLWLGSGGSFYVDCPLGDTVELLTSESTLPVAFSCVRWRDPEGPHFDATVDLPTYSRTTLMVRPSDVVAIEEAEIHEIAALRRGMAHQEVR